MLQASGLARSRRGLALTRTTQVQAIVISLSFSHLASGMSSAPSEALLVWLVR